MRRALIALGVLCLLALGCGSASPRRNVSLYPTDEATPNATQTPFYIIHTQTPNATQTAVVVRVVETPNAWLCVDVQETVYLRPSPNADNYPIAVIPNGARVRNLGGKSGDWVFVELGKYQGWVNSEYVKGCK